MNLFVGMLVVGCLAGVAIADEMDDLLIQSAPKNEYVSATFKSTRIVNLPTTEVQGAGDLNFLIAHRFGPLSSGPAQAFGLDMAKMRLGLEYGIASVYQIGIGRGNGAGKPLDVSAKAKLLRQKEVGMPVTIALQSTGYVRTEMPEDLPYELTMKRRLSSAHHLLAARKFNENLSLELAGILVTRNLVPTDADNAVTGLAGIGGRYKLSRRVVVTADAAVPVPLDHNGKNAKPVIAGGFDFDTGGHVFQLYATNAPLLSDDRLLTETTGSPATALRLGFQINRTFGLGG